MPISRTPPTGTTPRAPSPGAVLDRGRAEAARARSAAIKEPPGPLSPESITFMSPTGEQRHGTIDRHIYRDAELVGKNGALGPAVDWRVNLAGVYNVFWTSLNNRADPALLRAQARFLELSATSQDPRTVLLRNDLKKMLGEMMVGDGLPERELNYFPKETAVAIVARVAAAAGIDLDLIVVAGDTRHTEVPIETWASEPATRWKPTYRPLVEKHTEAGWKSKRDRDAEVAKMTTFFEKNPHSTLRDYSRYRDDIAAGADTKFWRAMEEMIEQGDLSSMAGRPGLRGGGGGGGGGWYATSPVSTRTAAPPAPAPSPTPAAPATRPQPTAWEILSSPGVRDFFDAKAGGYTGSYTDFFRR